MDGELGFRRRHVKIHLQEFFHMAPVIETVNLAKVYRTGFWKQRKVKALEGLTLQVEEGEIFGFLGPNGAGKTTTLKLLMRIIHPSSGKAFIFGQSIGHPSIFSHVGYLPEQPYFYDYLTAEELLFYLGRLAGVPRKELGVRVRESLETVGLSATRKIQLRKFSKGMLQRIGLAQAIINHPRILFLDEPFSGLDPIGRRELRDLVLELNRQGVTIFFSSHILPDMESLCKRYAIIHKGVLLESGKLQEALEHESQILEVVVGGFRREDLPSIADLVQEVNYIGDRLRFLVHRDAGLTRIIETMERAGARILAIQPVRPSLEEIFFHRIEGNLPPKKSAPRSATA